MLTVRLHGHLEEKFGSEFRFQASSVREVIDALQANFDDFTEEFIKDERAYNILVDYEMQDINGCVLPVKTDSVIDIIPIIAGAGNIFKSLALIVVGALLITFAPYVAGALLPGVTGASLTTFAAAGLVTATQAAVIGAVTAIGWGLALAGVASLLAGPDGPDGGGEQSSSLNSAENIVGQGMPIPIGYGRLMVGSVVLSATYTSSYVRTSQSYTYENTSTGYWQDKQISYGQARPNITAAEDDGYIPPASTYDGGYTPEQLTKVIEAAEAQLGNGTFEIVNYNPSAGVTLPVSKYVPVKIAGSYNDSAINHR